MNPEHAPAHTPGPWRVTYRPNGDIYEIETVRQDDGYRHITNDLPTGNRRLDETGWLEQRANVTAIACVPELLAEARHTLRNLESMLRMLPLDADPTERRSLETWAERNRALIAKATEVPR